VGHAYTPGLKVTDSQIVKKSRILPLKGEVIVKVGDRVQPDDVVAHTHLPGNVVPINVANILGIPPEDLEMVMTKREKEPIKEGEQIALKKSIIKWFNKTCKATINGNIESISHITGQVLQRGMPIPVEVKAYLRGEIVEVIPTEGIIVACQAAFVQGIFGIGGETYGNIHVAVSDNATILSEDLIKENMAGQVVVGGSLVTAGALKKAIRVKAKGIVVGGFDDKDLRDFLGYDIGVAITGSEDIGITLVVTEGFGQINMAQKTFDLLRKHEGEMACINGATQIRAGVIRPEVVIPRGDVSSVQKSDTAEIHGLEIGSPIRVIRHPHFGKLGKVTSLPPKLQKLESESSARVLEVEFEDRAKAIVPRANVEMIED
jgi:hypothetical protein